MKTTKLLHSLTLSLLTLFGAQAAPLGRVLVLVTEAQKLTLQEGKEHITGYYLSELALPAQVLEAVGFELSFATPTGKIPQVDPASDKAEAFKDTAEWRQAQAWLAGKAQLQKPLSLAQISNNDLDTYDALFVPGGHGAMEDLPKSAEVGRVLRYFHHHGKPLALICHGPDALIAAAIGGGAYPFAGYQMTVFSNREEQMQEATALGGRTLYYGEDELNRLGAKVITGEPWQSQAIRDRELITGRNPMSHAAFTNLLVEALIEQKLATAQMPALQRVLTPAQGWAQGLSTLYLGLRRSDVSKEVFAQRLQAHIELAKARFAPMGLQGYFVSSAGEYEVAYLNWSSEEAMNTALATHGAEVIADAEAFMSTVFFQSVQDAARVQRLLQDVAYVRFWRGQQRADLNAEQFRQGINRGLIPATIALTQTRANLIGYKPVLLATEPRVANLPAEIALVEYRDAASYAAYRSTPEGKAYGDLHWEFFNRDTSKSVLPQTFIDRLQNEEAYVVQGASEGPAKLRVLGIEGNNETHLSELRERMHAAQKAGVRRVLLLAADYALEYSFGAVNDAPLKRWQERANAPLMNEQRHLNWNEGLNFSVR